MNLLAQLALRGLEAEALAEIEHIERLWGEIGRAEELATYQVLGETLRLFGRSEDAERCFRIAVEGLDRLGETGFNSTLTAAARAHAVRPRTMGRGRTARRTQSGDVGAGRHRLAVRLAGGARTGAHVPRSGGGGAGARGGGGGDRRADRLSGHEGEWTRAPRPRARGARANRRGASRVRAGRAGTSSARVRIPRSRGSGSGSRSSAPSQGDPEYSAETNVATWDAKPLWIDRRTERSRSHPRTPLIRQA